MLTSHERALGTARQRGEPAGQIAARQLEVARIGHALRRAEDLPSDVAAAIEAEAGACYNGCMVIASGRVVGGRVELDTELPEGTSVTVLAREGDETFEADPETERMLLDSIAQCERGETIPLTQLLSELRDRE